MLPSINPFSFGEDDFNFDDSVTATCSVTKGDIPMKLWWTFMGEDDQYPQNLSTSDGIVISRTGQKLSVLNIEAVKARHRGNYSCFAQNRAGVAQQHSYLSINGLHYSVLSLSSLFLRNFAICFKFYYKFIILTALNNQDFLIMICFFSSSSNHSIFIW